MLIPLTSVGEAEHFLRRIVSNTLVVLLSQQKHQQFFQFSIFYSLVIFHPSDYRMIFLQQTLVLLDKVTTQFLKIFLIIPQLLNLSSNRDLIVFIGIDLNLLVFFLLDLSIDVL